MGDPLSISTSVITVLGAGISVSKAITTVIQAYNEAPVAITALSNEITELVFVLKDVRSRALPETSLSHLAAVLARADAKLEELRQFVASLGVVDTAGRWRRKLERVKWTEKKNRAQELKRELYDIKDDMVLLLSTGILYQVYKANSTVSLISQRLEATLLRDKQHHDKTSKQLVNYGPKFTELLEKVEPIHQMVEEQQSQRDMLQSIKCAVATCTQPSDISLSNDNQGNLIGVRFEKYNPYLRACNQWCFCTCHRRRRMRSPPFLDSFCGVFYFDYSGMPVLTPSCNESACWRRSTRIASLTYHFPKWLLRRVISIAVMNSLEPTCSLKISRIVDSSAEIFRLIVIGDIEGIKCLFKQGKASPNDVEPHHGTSALQLALHVKMPEVSKLLLQAGADPHIVDFNGSTAMEYAQLQIYYNGYYDGRSNVNMSWDRNELSQLRQQISFDSSFIQERQFGRLHKAVLQNNSERLRHELELSTRDINLGDSTGCTPLHWAAIRHDPECLRILLDHGANPNIADRDHCCPINEISWHGVQDEKDMHKRDRCIQVFIEHGKSIYGTQYLNKCFPMYWTPLSKACYANRHAAVIALLAAGAQIQHESSTPVSALDLCVWENSHESLGLLLNEKEQLKNLTTGAWWTFLRATQDSADALTLRMLVDAELTVKGVTAEEWEWLACLTPRISTQRPITDNTHRGLYREFIEGLRQRAGLNPARSPLKWIWPDDELSCHNFGKYDDKELDPGGLSELESGGNFEQDDDVVFKDAVEYHVE